jgi:hypothetical protein
MKYVSVTFQRMIKKNNVIRRLLIPEFQEVKLTSPQRKFNDHHHDLVDRYGVSVSQLTTDMFHLL